MRFLLPASFPEDNALPAARGNNTRCPHAHHTFFFFFHLESPPSCAILSPFEQPFLNVCVYILYEAFGIEIRNG